MATLETIKSQFDNFRSEHSGVSGKGLRYPQELQKMLLQEKESGKTLQDLAEASGISVGGLARILARFQSSQPVSKMVSGKSPGQGKQSQAAAKFAAGAKNGSARSVSGQTASQTEGAVKRKVGRPPKSAQVPSAPASSGSAKKAATLELAAPKKRGRPPKIQLQDSPSPVKRGRPAASIKTAVTTVSSAERNRLTQGKRAEQLKAAASLQNVAKGKSSKKKSDEGEEISISLHGEGQKEISLLIHPRDFLKVLREMASN